ncbi:MAG TPA: hypothetical protein EYO22_00550 [Candidatus Poseidoniales archaeon]|nr:hypothetical protein [Candidatus Poseidoniales archaeon]HIB41642.1 hypothetical protein [Candidatus Poseidoniales archaeon]HIO86908.1 hypothetical protein [Candidatus Poseidoniales archaeon]
MQTGPPGPPSSGPAGPSSAGPPDSPSPRPTGPPSSRPKGPPRSSASSSLSSGEVMDEGAFERLAEKNVVRQAEIERREKVVVLKKLRNGKRNNVILLLLLVVVFGAIAVAPFSQGDISNNPHEFSQEVDILNRNDPTHPAAWEQLDIELMSTKIWDGNDEFSGSITHDLNIPGIPIDIAGVTTIPVDVTLVSYRVDGANTGFRLALFPSPCDEMYGQTIESLEDRYKYGSITPMIIGSKIKISFDVPAGKYCLVFEYENPPEVQGFRATIDAEVTPRWNLPLCAPLAAISLVLAIFAGVGAHKAGKAWKKVAQPASPAKKSTEEEVLEQAEEERGTMSETLATSDTGEVDAMDSPTPSEQPSSTPQIDESIQATAPEVTEAPALVAEPTPEVVAPAPEVAEPAPEVAEPAPEVAEPTPEVAEPAPAQPVYTDEELRALGWTDQQIEWQRQSEQMQ